MSNREFLDGRVTLHAGDCREVLASLPEASVDSVVCDPPYGLEFMGKGWDSFTGAGMTKPGIGERETDWPSFMGTNKTRCRACGHLVGQGGSACKCDNPQPYNAALPRSHGFGAWCFTWATEVFRVLKPGGFMVAMGGDRTYHRLASAIEDAGFEVRGSLAFLYGSGFPKSLNVSRDLLSLPWCACGSAEVTSARAIASVPSHEALAATDADPGIPGRGAFGGCSAGAVRAMEDACLPLEHGRALVGTEPIAPPADALAANGARRLRDKFGSRARHRRSAMQGAVKHAIGQADPIVLGPPDMTGVAKGKQVLHGVGHVENQPEALRDEVVRNQVIAGGAVGADPIAGDHARCDITPASTLVRPLTAAPSWVAVTAEPGLISGNHAGSRTVDGRRPALECVPPEGISASGTEPLGRTTVESRHAELIRALVSKNHISVCAECGQPIRPHWLIDGLGTALKPAMELICLARKPLAGTVVENVLRYGTGALNIDGCRVATAEVVDADRQRHSMGYHGGNDSSIRHVGSGTSNAIGRWPANLVLEDHPEVLAAFPETESGALPASTPRGKQENIYGARGHVFGDRDIPADHGSAARFFYTAKADAEDRLGSKHPTVKPLDLIQWLCRLVTPRGGTVLDPFAGTGTTGEAAWREGMRAILIEREPEYIADIARRMELAANPTKRTAVAKTKNKLDDPNELPLFKAEAAE